MFEGWKPFRNVEERRQRAIYLHFRLRRIVCQACKPLANTIYHFFPSISSKTKRRRRIRGSRDDRDSRSLFADAPFGLFTMYKTFPRLFFSNSDISQKCISTLFTRGNELVTSDEKILLRRSSLETSLARMFFNTRSSKPEHGVGNPSNFAR